MVEKPSGQRYVATVTVAGILLPESRPLNLRYCTVMPNPQASGHEQITMSNVVPEGKGPSAAIARTIAVREAGVDGPVSLDHATAQLEQLVLPLRLATPASVRLGYLKLRPGTLGEGAAEGSTHPGLDHLGPLALVELSADDCALIEATLPQLFYDRRIDDPLRRFTVAVNEEDRAEACLKFLVAGEALVNPNAESRDRKSRVSRRLARLTFGSEREGFREAQGLFRNVYDHRQSIWHGETNPDKTALAREWLDEHVEQVRAYVSFAIQRSLLLLRFQGTPFAEVVLQLQRGDPSTLSLVDSLPLVYFRPTQEIINLDLTKFTLSEGAGVEFVDSSSIGERESDTWHEEDSPGKPVGDDA